MDARKIELVYIDADKIGSAGIRPRCLVTRLDGHQGGRHWNVRHKYIPNMFYPIARPISVLTGIDNSNNFRSLCVGGQGGLIAFNSTVDYRYGIALMFADGNYKFLPLEEPPRSGLVSIDFSEDTRTLTLLYRERRTDLIGGKWTDGGYVTRFLKWDERHRLSVLGTVAGWFAHAWSRFAVLVDSAGTPFSYDFVSGRQSRGVGPGQILESRLWHLLNDRKPLRAKVSGMYSQWPDASSFNGSFPSRVDTIASSVDAMFVTDLAASLEDLSSDATDSSGDHVLDGVYSLPSGFVCMMTRVRSAPFRGFEFMNVDGTAFRFLSPGSFTMGFNRRATSPAAREIDLARDLDFAKYSPGIYHVDLDQKTIRYTSQPSETGSAITKGSPLADMLERASGALGYFMMRNGQSV